MSSFHLRALCGVTIVCLAATSAVARPSFQDVTVAAGIHHVQDNNGAGPEYWMTGGAAVADYDNDGWTDLFVTRYHDTDILYRNLGVDGNGNHLGFTDVSAAAFGPSPFNTRSNGAAFADVDNDGDSDLYVTTWNESRYLFYINNGDGTFTEDGVDRNAVSADNPVPHFGTGVAFGDYDDDGFLDLATAEWAHNKLRDKANARLLRNLGATNPGHFEDTTDDAGVNMAESGDVLSFSPRFTDLNADGRPDLAVASDAGTSRLFWNNGDGSFTDGTDLAGVGTGHSDMGSTVGDYDRDGDLDWFITDIHSQFNSEWDGNRLFQNNGDGPTPTFTDRTDSAGDGVRAAGWGWGATFIDYDNDGDLDLTMTNGPGYWSDLFGLPPDPMKLWENDGSGNFTDVASGVGLTDTGEGRGLLRFDFDNDGDQDIFVVRNNDTALLYRNDGGNDNDFIRIDTVGAVSNRDGINALITVMIDEHNPATHQVYEVDGGSNYLAHNEHTAHFGLGDLDGQTIDRIDILWPSGYTQTLRGVEPNRLLTVQEPPNVPEPTAALLLAPLALALARRRRPLRTTP